MKVHLKLKGKALCGTRPKKTPLKFVSDKEQVTCRNCLRAIER